MSNGNNGRFMRTAWEVGTTLYGMAKNAEQQALSEQAAIDFENHKQALLAENNRLTGFADAAELKRYKYNIDSIYLGRLHEDHEIRPFNAGVTDPRGVFVQAGSRSGKGRSIIIQNAIRWPGPLLMIDPKGEAASITAMRRGKAENAHGTGTSVRNFIGQNIAILDPFNEVKGPAQKYRIDYNPLHDIDAMDEEFSEQIRALVKSIVSFEQGSSAAHFSETTAIMFRGIIETVMLRETDANNRTLPYCYEKFFGSFEEICAYLKLCPKTPAGFARTARKIAIDMGVDEWSALNSTMSRNLEWLGSPKLLRHLGASDFSLVDAVQKGWSIYIVLPPTKMNDYKAWLRIITRTAINAKVALGDHQQGPQTLFMLDEFPLLGHFQIIEDSAGFLAGYGIKLMPIIQNLTQLTTHYPKNWEAFFANAAATVAWSLETKTDLENISYLMGRVTVWEESMGFSNGASTQHAFTGVGGQNAGSSSNLTKRERAVRFSNEIKADGAPETKRAFIIPSGGKPFMVRRQNYDDIKKPGLYDSPQFISAWEKQRARS